MSARRIIRGSATSCGQDLHSRRCQGAVYDPAAVSSLGACDSVLHNTATSNQMDVAAIINDLVLLSLALRKCNLAEWTKAVVPGRQTLSLQWESSLLGKPALCESHNCLFFQGCFWVEGDAILFNLILSVSLLNPSRLGFRAPGHRIQARQTVFDAA
jgi:hypothetical protein